MAKTICQIYMTIIIVLSVVFFTTLDEHDASHYNIDDIDDKNICVWDGQRRDRVNVLRQAVGAVVARAIGAVRNGSLDPQFGLFFGVVNHRYEDPCCFAPNLIESAEADANWPDGPQTVPYIGV